MTLYPRLVTVGRLGAGAIQVQADVTVLGSAVPVSVTLNQPYSMLNPPGFPFRASFTGAATPQYPHTVPAGTVLKVLQAEATALIAAGGTTQFPGFSSLSVAHGTNPTLILAIAGDTFNTGDTPATSAFTVLDGGSPVTVSSVTVSSSSISLGLTGTISLGDTVTLSYTPPGTSPAQDTSGNLLAAIASAPVTVS